MEKTIALVTTGHPPTDERIFSKMARTFVNNGYKVNIICSTLTIETIRDGISIRGFQGEKFGKRKKIRTLAAYLRDSEADIVICCEPLAVLAAAAYRTVMREKQVTVFSDITEWYPENVASKMKGLRKAAAFAVLFMFNIYASNLADALIIGEISKKRRYRLIAPFKPMEVIGYYPVLEYFQYNPPPFNGHILTLCYAGVITFERGILTLLETALKIAELRKDLVINLKIVGRFQYRKEEEIFLNKIQMNTCINIEMVPWGDYDKISEKLSDADICFDLRKRTFIYRNSLPIKIFEYMACGKPFIYSDIKPIRKEMDPFQFGYLVNPEIIDEITGAILDYVDNNELLLSHSRNARKMVEDKFNWERESKRLLNYISLF